jgi:two-component system phosphate regulon sensor histidine kinase PhoR
MTGKIFRAVFASCILVAAMTVGLVVLALNNYFVTIEEERIASEADLAAAGVNAAGEGYFDDLNIEGYRLTWINGSGTVLYDSQADAATMENHGDRQEVKEALLSGTGKSDRNSSTLAEETMYYAERCNDGTVVRFGCFKEQCVPARAPLSNTIAVGSALPPLPLPIGLAEGLQKKLPSL